MVQWKMEDGRWKIKALEELLIESNELTRVMLKAKSSANGNK